MIIHRTLLFLTVISIFPTSSLAESSISGLTGYWSLDENGLDQSANHNDLKIIDHFQSFAPNWIPQWTEGQFGSALNLPGYPRKAFTYSAPVSALQTPSVTLSAWVYPRSELGNDQHSVLREWEWVAAQGDNYGLFLTPGNQGVTFYIKDTDGDWSGVFTPNNSFRYDEWQHVAGSFDATSHTLRVYVDGQEVGLSSIGGNIEYSTGNAFTVGSMKKHRNFNGIIDEVKVFDSSLSGSDIEQLSFTSTTPSDDTQAPVITLTGDNPYIILVNEPYVDLGAKAVDDVDGEVAVSSDFSTVNTSQTGTYTVIYTAKDNAKNLATATRDVNVVFRSPGYSGLWQLDRVVNEVTVDQSTHGTNLTVNNNVELIEGKHGSALAFNGFDQDASTSDAAVLQTPSVSIHAWIKPRSNPENSQWEWVAAQADNYGLYLTPENKGINFYIKDTNGGWHVAASSDNSFQYDQWQSISGSFNNDTGILRVRQNGVTIGSNHARGIEYSTGNGFTIGSMQGQRFFTGGIDQVVIFDHTPTHSEGTLPANPTGKLNDTGVTECADYAGGRSGSGHHSNHSNCIAPDPQSDPIPPGQDAVHGRDANPATNDDGDGHAGFSFTKLNQNGVPLTDQTTTTFNCVKDNVTGLIWEVKTGTALHRKTDTYSWYSPDDSVNGGSKGSADHSGNSCIGYDSNNETSLCNTDAFVARVNILGWCGASDWRLPTRKELESIVDYSVSHRTSRPTIDQNYFPNTVADFYRTSSPVASFSEDAWTVSFIDGAVNFSAKLHSHSVRLVRGK